MQEQFDIISIGDIVTDAFIRISDATVSEDATTHEARLCMAYGAKVPFDSVTVLNAVGNSPNAAVSSARLGLKTALVSDLGFDDVGIASMKTVEGNHIDTRFIRIHPDKISNYHYVLWHIPERTILIKHETYGYQLPDIGNPRWIYLSSLGKDSLDYHEQISRYLREHPEVKFAFQPGTFQIQLGTEKLRDFYQHCEVFFCNVEEARQILQNYEIPKEQLARKISELGPKISVITDGPSGAYAYTSYENKVYYMPIYPDPKPPFERTGAGDAFSSTFTSALALGKSVPEAMEWGPINSMSVVQQIGAQAGLLSREALEELLRNRPDWYYPKEIEG